MKLIKILFLITVFISSNTILFAQDNNTAKDNKLTMVVVGSSVAYGSGATNDKGWARMLEDKLESTGHWDVINKCIGGNTTKDVLSRLSRDVLSCDPDMVVIGLSLANEGLCSDRDPQDVYTSYTQGLKKITQILQANDITPVICNCYPNSNYDYAQYSYIRQMNFEINSWPLPSINFLSAVDNGHGQWTEGHSRDAGHPNDNGHTEMYYNIPISFFDNYIGQDPYTIIDSDKSITLFGQSETAPLECNIENEMHSLTIIFEFRPLELTNAPILEISPGLTLSVNSKKRLEYNSGNQKITSTKKLKKGQAYNIALVISYNESTAQLYLDGKQLGQIFQTPTPINKILLGGDSTTAFDRAQYRNCLIYRGALNSEELEFVFDGNILRSSLQLYSPFYDPLTLTNTRLINLAPTSSYFLVKDNMYRLIK